MSEKKSRIAVCITGASGARLGFDLIRILTDYPVELHIVVSDTAKKIAQMESGIDFNKISGEFANNLKFYENSDMFAPLASGSFGIDAVCVVPCSMKTLSAVANGYSSTLISRVADIAIKQGKKLVIMPRESPLNAIHLENMLKLNRMGAIIIPPLLTFYHQPKTLNDIINFNMGKVLDAFGFEHDLYRKWGGSSM